MPLSLMELDRRASCLMHHNDPLLWRHYSQQTAYYVFWKYVFQCHQKRHLNVLCIDFNEFLIWVFPTTFWRHIDNSPFQQLQQCLLYPFSRHVVVEGLSLLRAILSISSIIRPLFQLYFGRSRCLKKSSENALRILSNITCLCQNCSIDYRQGYIEHFCYRFGDQCFLFLFLQPL